MRHFPLVSDKEIEYARLSIFFSGVLNQNEREYTIDKVDRLHSYARQNQGQSSGPRHNQNPRLVRVILSNEEMARKIISAAGRADLPRTEFKDIKVFHDRSKEERLQRKELLAEAKTHNQESVDSNSTDRWFANFRTWRVERRTLAEGTERNQLAASPEEEQ